MPLILENGNYSSTIDTSTLTSNQTITFPNTSGTIMVSSGAGGNLLDMFYPVGSIYMTANASFNPNNQFGGTWSKIENRFLYGSGSKSVGATGGAETVTLTTSQIPSHSHGVGSINAKGRASHGWSTNESNYWSDGVFYSGQPGNYGVGSSGTGYQVQYFDMSRNRSGNTSNSGGGGSHTNMPPYIVVAIWKRTA